jgi:hypothetical protein
MTLETCGEDCLHEERKNLAAERQSDNRHPFDKEKAKQE